MLRGGLADMGRHRALPYFESHTGAPCANWLCRCPSVTTLRFALVPDKRLCEKHAKRAIRWWKAWPV